MKKVFKLLFIIIFIVFIILILFGNKSDKKLKKLGYVNEEIKLFYEYEFDIDTILKYGYCKDINDILNDEFDKNNLDSYLSECNKVVTSNPIGENNEEDNSEENDLIKELKNQKYYIPDNLERYLEYSKNGKEPEDIVRDVNCNIDNEFYTNTKKTDTSLGKLMLVNKYNYVDDTYVPNNKTLLEVNKYSLWTDAYLEKEVYNAFIKMIDDGNNLGYELIDTSPYRSYDYQSYLYQTRVNSDGVEAADRLSARPGFSEHQTGYATDIVKKGVSMYDFGTTKEFTWLSNNAHKYGFILRYPEGKEYLTGYIYEPWHYRYVGIDVATYIYENDIVFEEYYAYYCEYKKAC